jgi:DNA-binding HxlR family transcriptional regulator
VHTLILERHRHTAKEGTSMSTEQAITVVTQQGCPVTAVLRRVGDRWSPVLLYRLALGGHGFNELDRAIEGISRRMLTRTLRALESEDLVRRTPDPLTGRVEYALTERGDSLRAQLATLGRWALDHPAAGPPDR